MDAFYAAIEQLDDPALRGRPILVGSPSDRGVVLTASYEARPYGVGSAMPMAQARRKCPNALIVPPRFDRYQQVSKMNIRRKNSAAAMPPANCAMTYPGTRRPGKLRLRAKANVTAGFKCAPLTVPMK
jgi:hypothetical protein